MILLMRMEMSESRCGSGSPAVSTPSRLGSPNTCITNWEAEHYYGVTRGYWGYNAPPPIIMGLKGVTGVIMLRLPLLWGYQEAREEEVEALIIKIDAGPGPTLAVA